jgi:mono/diheme cytochrome c family protein
MKFLIGFIIGLLILPVAGFFYFKSGLAPVATRDSTMPFEGWAARTALHVRLNRDMPRAVPIQASTENYVAGAKIYKDHCSGCHGFKGQDQPPEVKAMFPKPPELFKGKGVTDDPPEESYWKVANGIRLSGMPSYEKALTQEQMWQVSLLLANADKLPAEVQPIIEGK